MVGMQFSKMLLLAGGAALVSWAAPADLRVLEEIVAKVNGDIITRSELEKSRANMLADLQQRGAKPPQLEQSVSVGSFDSSAKVACQNHRP